MAQVRKVQILIIEDSDTTRFYYKNLFQRSNFDVLEANNAADGWSLICEKKPDLIVLDMMMPEIPGIALLKRIRSYEFSKHIPVLVLTSLKDAEDVQEIFKTGASHYCLKGMDSPETIMDTVSILLKRERERRQILEMHGETTDRGEELSALDRNFFWL